MPDAEMCPVFLCTVARKEISSFAARAPRGGEGKIALPYLILADCHLLLSEAGLQSLNEISS